MKIFVIAILCVAISLTLYFILIQPPDQRTKQAQEQATKQAANFKCSDGFTPGIQNPAKTIRPEQVTGSDYKKHDVIVIGAGMAGLEAANQLDSKGLDVMVLEAQDRIGGRVYTYNYSGTALDLGGSWIHGLDKANVGFENPIYKIASENNIATTETVQTTTLYNSTGHQFVDDSNDRQDRYEKFAEKYNKIISNDQRKEISIQNVINKYYNSIEPMDRTEKAKYRYTMYWNYDMDLADDANRLAFENSLGNQYFNSDEEHEVIFPDGYSQIVNCLAGGLAIKHEIKRANVIKVDYTNKPIIVTTDNGTFRANYTISTLPLGVLKKNNLFYPLFNESDPAKADAIKHLKMATMDKVYLIFNNTNDLFWSTGNSWINRIPDVEDNNTYKESDKKWQFFFNLYYYYHKPILLAFNTGSQAEELENETDTTIKNEVMAVLKKMYKDQNISEPKIIRTKWYMDPFSGGSYSAIPLNGSLDDFDKLKKPIYDRLFFAGEATDKYYYGTVHGAYISGYRAAEEILKLENKLDKLDYPTEQLKHGIKRSDVICQKGYELKDETSTENVKCVPKK